MPVLPVPQERTHTCATPESIGARGALPEATEPPQAMEKTAPCSTNKQKVPAHPFAVHSLSKNMKSQGQNNLIAFGFSFVRNDTLNVKTSLIASLIVGKRLTFFQK